MQYVRNNKINGFYEYVVPPLEGFWWQDGVQILHLGPYDDEPASVEIDHLDNVYTKKLQKMMDFLM